MDEYFDTECAEDRKLLDAIEAEIEHHHEEMMMLIVGLGDLLKKKQTHSAETIEPRMEQVWE